MQKWTLNTNIFEKWLIYIPVDLPGLWMFVAFDVGRMVLEHYDSLGGVNMEVVDKIAEY